MPFLTLDDLKPSTHAKVSPEALELMGRDAANSYLDKGVPLNESIAKLASAHRDFNAEQVMRVVEFANTAVYLALHDKNKTAQAGSSYPQFELADAARIIQELSDGARPTVTTPTDLSYMSQPTKKDKISSADSNAMLDELFKSSSVADPVTKESLLHDVMTVKHELTALVGNLKHSGERFDLIEKQASEDYYQGVKDYLLGGGSLSHVLVAARSTGVTEEKLASAMKPIVARILTEKVATPNRLQEEARGIDKVAHRVVNPQHILVSSFGGMVTAQGEIEKIATALTDAETQLKRIEDFIKEAFCAGHSR